MKSWSRGQCWDVVADGREPPSLLLTIHDAPRWIAEDILKQAERFVKPLSLLAVVDCQGRSRCKVTARNTASHPKRT